MRLPVLEDGKPNSFIDLPCVPNVVQEYVRLFQMRNMWI